MNEGAFEYLRPLVAPLSLRAVRISGAIQAGGRTISALYVGSGRNLGWLVRLLFREPTSDEIANGLRPWHLTRTLRFTPGDFDITLTELPPLWSFLQRSHSDIMIPAWIRQEILLRRDAVSPWRLPRDTSKEIARTIRKYRYRLELSTRSDDIATFYKRLYRPYIQSRFRSAAGIVTAETFLQQSGGNTLAKLISNDGWIAGMLLSSAGTTLKFGWFGAVSDPPPKGASAALDALCLQHAVAQGMQRVVLGNSRPSLADGVVAYKQQFGSHIVATRYPQVSIGIGIRRWTPELIRCLREQALIGLHRRQLVLHDIDERSPAPTVTMRPLERDRP
jgi:hypothetical protein